MSRSFDIAVDPIAEELADLVEEFFAGYYCYSLHSLASELR